ncbi:hypothetical protein [Micromonospora sp. NPDC001898]|uniref:hypothetical protein n=1 Tax=Micromonospora sp. NPDC001898 TaxID=3364221 RepID=UPI0036CF708A
MAMPKDVEMDIVWILYADARELDWEHLTDTEKSASYDQWAQDPRFTDRLSLWVKTPQERRVWIKDGPMKEYARARNGVGKYAVALDSPTAEVSEHIRMALGPDWEANLDTLSIKPLRVLACRADETVNFAWAPAKDFKHLVWAALKAQAYGDSDPWVLCVVSSFAKPIKREERLFHQKMGERCGLRVAHITGRE